MPGPERYLFNIKEGSNGDMTDTQEITKWQI
jgi:hypothetical protein